ncbi:MAG: hypothetical protein DWQ07_14325 [Chloroflexi bacterium]|nr:MAG: hypothetical protein DWQ07_14325 [Chloroflexota bacterium]MBL1195740.1 hypothetical protein [Chloroflexota bacterium]NOH13029.1 hypothetical protein [Chloroflexota bacterium]
MSDPDFPSIYKSREGYRAIQAWYDRTLAQLSIPVQSHYIPTDLGKTHLLELGEGDKPPLILLHPLSANALMWSPQFEALSQHFRLIVPDIIGMAGRSGSTRPSYKSDAHAHW